MWKNGQANFKNLAVIEFLHKKRIKLNSGWTFSRLLTDGWNETIGSIILTQELCIVISTLPLEASMYLRNLRYVLLTSAFLIKTQRV